MRAAILLVAGALTLPGATCFVTVAGLGGEPDYEQRFSAWAREIELTLRSSGGESKVETLDGKFATREAVREALGRMAAECKPQDDLVVMLIGHGTFDGYEYKFNLPGPDISGVELAGLLDRIPAERQLVVNMTSASGGSLAALSKENRVVITATKTGTQKNATIFARYWAEALRDPSADVDKTEAISALEAFRYADRKTAEYFESQKRLATEQALLDDIGNGEGVRSPSPENGQGKLASAFTIVRFGAAQAAAKNPEKRKLYAKKEELEQAIDRLKYQKAALPEEEYRKKLTALLIELARTQGELEK